MKRVCLLICLCVAASLTLPGMQDAIQGQEEERAPALKDLAFLAGQWEGDMWGGKFRACYSTPETGRVLGHSELQSDGRVSFYEFEVFREVDGKLTCEPYPGGKRAVGFELATLDSRSRRATFENPGKDYPTRIVYHQTEEGRLVITLSDPFGASEKIEVFDLSQIGSE